MDIGAHTVTVTGYYTNYPSSNAHAETISFNIVDCDASSTSCECAEISLASSAGLGTIDLAIPSSPPVGDVTLGTLPSMTLSNAATGCALTRTLQLFDATA